MMKTSKRIISLVLSLALLLTSVMVSVGITAMADNTVTALQAAVEAHVAEKGNSVTRSSLLSAVQSSLNDDTITLEASDYYFKHAINGAVDVDSDKTTRINIPGSDGAVAAVFNVGGNRIGVTAVVEHTVKNYGTLAVATVGGKTDDNGNLIIQTINNTDPNTLYKVILPVNTAYVDYYYSGGWIKNLKFAGGTADNVVAIVVLGHNGPFRMFRAFSGLEVFQMADNVTPQDGSSGNFLGLKNLKYVHLSENFLPSLQWQIFENCTALENVNIPSSVTTIENAVFTNTGLREIEYGSNVSIPEYNITFDEPNLAEGAEGRNIVVKGSEMTFAQAAAYAQVAATTAGAFAADTADTVAGRIMNNVVYSGTLSTSWNGSFAVDESTNTAAGTFTLTNADGDTLPISYQAELPDGDVDMDAVKATVEATFETYVSENGNSVTRSGLLAAVNEAILSLNAVAELGSSDYYFYHAVDGVIDQDTNAETRINIEGHDGAVTAIFVVGDTRIALSAVVKHSVEDLGLLPIAEVSGIDDPDYPGRTLITKINMTDADAKYKIVLPEGTSRLKINYNDKNSIDYGSGKQENIVAMVILDHGPCITEGYKYFNGLRVVQMADDITIDNGKSGSTNFMGCTNLKYVHLSDAWAPTIEWRMFQDCTALENINIPSSVTKIENAVFTNTGLREIEYSSTVSIPLYSETFNNPALAEGEEGRNIVVKGSKMNFVQAVSYAQVGATKAGAYFGDTADDVTERILADVVYTENLNPNWNSTYTVDTENDTVSGTLTLISTAGDTIGIKYSGKTPKGEVDTDALTATVKEAFDAYVTEKGNAVTKDGLLSTVKAAISKFSCNAKLTDEYFYIKHSVDGAIDEDTNEKTRINIEGRDGIVVAVFEVYGQRIALTKTLKHTVKNYGTLAIAEVGGTLDDDGNLIIQTIANTDSNTKYKVVLPENTAYVDHYYSGGWINNLSFAGGNADNVVAIVVLGHNGPFRMFRAFSGLEVFQMADNVTLQDSSSGNFLGLKNLKYVHLSENFLPSLQWQIFENCTALENVNIPSSVTTIENAVFTNTGLREIEYKSTVSIPKYNETFNSPALAEGVAGRNIVSIGEDMTYAQAVAYAFEGVESTEYAISYDEATLIDKIMSKVANADEMSASFKNTLTVDAKNKTVKGTLSLTSTAGDVISFAYSDNWTMTSGVSKVEYLEFDTADKAMAIRIDSINCVTEVGVEVEIVTASGTQTVTVSTDYINAAANGKKPYIALADKVYYVDVNGDGEITADDIAALRKLLLAGGTDTVADLTGDKTVDLLDLVRFKKIMTAQELTFDIAYEGYTFAFAFGDIFAGDGITSASVRPYCVQAGEKVYGETQVLTQFISDYTPIVKP